jgi:hypothetical protein
LTAEQGVGAVIDIVGDDALVAVDVWIVKKAPRRFEVTRVAVEPDTANRSERLALRAIEALRGSLLQIDSAAQERRNEAIAKPANVTLPKGEMEKPARRRAHFGLELGAAALMSFDRVGPAVLPMVRLGWAARSWFVVQAALAGLGSQPTVAATVGKADVAQQYGILGGCFRFRSEQRLAPFFALSAGVLHTTIEGRSGLGTEGHTVDKWSFLLDGSIGAGLRLHPRYYLTLAAHVQVAEPYVVIHFADTVGATTGRPNVLLTLAVGAWL